MPEETLRKGKMEGGVIRRELKNHAPFTSFGAVTGIIIMLIFYKIPFKISHTIFYILHPLHVLLSSLVTASMYRLHIEAKWWKVVIIGYIGSIGIATLSDSIIPFLGEWLLKLPNKGIHIGFIEKWYLVNPLAFAGIGISFIKPTTKLPHSGHVLLSTWASLFHIIMALGGVITILKTIVIFFFLFIAVWFPCCLSDIIFPLLFVKEKTK